MKRLSLILTTVLLLSSMVVATNISYGFKAGLAFSNQDFKYQTDLDIGPDYRLGFQGGAFAEFALTPNFSVQANVQYVPAGFKTEAEETTEANPEGTGKILTIKPRIDYLSIPVLVKAGMPSGQVSPFLIVGPRVNIQVGIDKSYMTPAYDYLKKVSIGLTVGAGAELQVSPKAALMIEVSYSPDFTNIFDADEAKSKSVGSQVTLESVKNRTISVLAGVRF